MSVGHGAIDSGLARGDLWEWGRLTIPRSAVGVKFDSVLC